jgi:hypothetical protein
MPDTGSDWSSDAYATSSVGPVVNEAEVAAEVAALEARMRKPDLLSDRVEAALKNKAEAAAQALPPGFGGEQTMSPWQYPHMVNSVKRAEPKEEFPVETENRYMALSKARSQSE